jgi:membrane protease YdiL (CAAX protease family)
LLGIVISVSTFPIVYWVFKVIFDFSTQEFVQSGTLAYYFYTEFAYPSNIICYSIWTFLVIALGEELFFRGFIHNKLEQKLTFTYAAITSSAIFSVVHLLSIALFPLPMVFIYLALTFIFAFLLAYTLHCTGNLMGCWFSHAISNILAGIFIGIL